MKQMKKYLVCVVIALLMVFSPVMVKAAVTDATDIRIGQTITGSLETIEQKDYYKFTTGNELCSYTLAGTGINADVAIAICDSTERVIESFSAGSTGDSVTVKLNSGETYYVRINERYGNTTYSFCITAQKDEADKLVDAENISLDTNITASICTVEDVDYYKFATNSELAGYTLEATGIDSEIVASICDSKEQQLGYCCAYENGNQFTVKLKPNEIYYIKIYTRYSVSNYSFKITSEIDEADEMENAEIVDILENVRATLCTEDDVDWFAFETEKAARYDFTFVGINGEIRYAVCNEKHAELISGAAGASGDDISVDLKSSAKYYVKISGGYTAKTEYSFSATKNGIKVAKSSINRLSASNKTIRVSIKKGKKIDGYELQYATSKNMKGAKKISGKNGNYTIKNAKNKKTYYVRVKSFLIVDGKKIYSDWSSVKKISVKQ